MHIVLIANAGARSGPDPAALAARLADAAPAGSTVQALTIQERGRAAALRANRAAAGAGAAAAERRR